MLCPLFLFLFRDLSFLFFTDGVDGQLSFDFLILELLKLIYFIIYKFSIGIFLKSYGYLSFLSFTFSSLHQTEIQVAEQWRHQPHDMKGTKCTQWLEAWRSKAILLVVPQKTRDTWLLSASNAISCHLDMKRNPFLRTKRQRPWARHAIPLVKDMKIRPFIRGSTKDMKMRSSLTLGSCY